MDILLDVEKQIYTISNRLQDKLEVLFDDMGQHLRQVEMHINALEEYDVCDAAKEIIREHKLLVLRANDRLKWMACVNHSLTESIYTFVDQIEDLYSLQIFVDVTQKLDTIPMNNQQILLNLLVDLTEGILEDNTTESIYLRIYMHANDLWIIFRDNGMRSLHQMYSQTVEAAISGQLKHLKAKIEHKIVSVSFIETKIVIPLEVK